VLVAWWLRLDFGGHLLLDVPEHKSHPGNYRWLERCHASHCEYLPSWWPDIELPDTGLPDTGLPDTGLPDTGLLAIELPEPGWPLLGTELPDIGLPGTGLVVIELPEPGWPLLGTELPDTGLPGTGLVVIVLPEPGWPLLGTELPDIGELRIEAGLWQQPFSSVGDKAPEYYVPYRPWCDHWGISSLRWRNCRYSWAYPW